MGWGYKRKGRSSAASKKTGYRRRTTAKRAMHAGRYKGRARPPVRRARSGKRGMFKSSARGDSSVVAHAYGHRQKISQKFATKVRQAAANVDSYTYNNSFQVTSTQNEATYFGTHFDLKDPLNLFSTWNNIPSKVVTNKFTVLDETMRVDLVSRDTLPFEMIAYECQARNDVGVGQGGNLNSLVTYMNQGFLDATGTSNYGIMLDSSPFQSPALTVRFKITSVKRFVLGPGERKTFSLTDNTPMLVNMERFLDTLGTNNDNLIALRKKTRGFIFKLVGPVINGQASGGDYLDVGFGQGSVNVIEHHKMNYSYIQDDQSTNFFSQNVSATTGAYGINPETGADITEAFAE